MRSWCLADTPSLSSADVAEVHQPADPVYRSSARVFVDDIPSDEGPFLGFFKLSTLLLVAMGLLRYAARRRNGRHTNAHR